jgi:hypothetical protein
MLWGLTPHHRIQQMKFQIYCFEPSWTVKNKLHFYTYLVFLLLVTLARSITSNPARGVYVFEELYIRDCLRSLTGSRNVYSNPPTFGLQIILKWVRDNFVCIISYCVNLLQIKMCYCQGNHIENTPAQISVSCTSLNNQFMELHLK